MSRVTSSHKNYTDLYGHILDRYADDAAFLWLLRSSAVHQPHYTAADVTQLDERIEAQLDGLMTAPERSWAICEAALSLRQAGEVFAASVVAFRSLDINKIQRVVEVGLADEGSFEGLVSAMAWLPGRVVHSWIKKFLTSKDLNHKYLAIAVCSARREDPKDYLAAILQRDDCMAHEKLYARSIRLIGEIKCFNLMPALRAAAKSDNVSINFWSHWSATLLGDKDSATALKPVALSDNPYQLQAIELCLRVLPVPVAREWVTLLSKGGADTRKIITASGILGDAHAVPWLISQMQVPTMSRVAGEAFTFITGIDLVEHGLSLDALPDLDAMLPGEGGDEHFAVDEDEHLPFPDANKIAAVWQKYQNRFTPGQRYFMGRPLESQHLHQIYAQGNQRQRKAAAMTLALVDPAQMLMNVAMKGNVEK